MMTEKQSAESGMNGAAIVLSDGREVPITHTMVQNTLEAMAEAMQPDKDRGNAQKPARTPARAHG